MKKKCVIFLFALGVAGFAYDFGWRRPKVKSLYNQSTYLVDLGITEEALHYRIEADALSKWGLPLSIVSYLFILPLLLYPFINPKRKHAKRT